MISSRKPLRPGQAWGRAILYLSLLAVAAAVVLPILIVAGSSLKRESEIFESPFRFLPTVAIPDNYLALKASFPLYVFNSAKLTAIIVLLQLITATMGAYAFAKLNFRGRDAIFMLYVASVMVPIQAIIIPQFVIVKRLGLYDSHWAIIAVSIFTAFGTFLVKQFFMTVPRSLVEAARIDGATEGQIFRKVMLPLSKPVLATLVIFSFRYFWNDFFTPLIYLSKPGLKTLPLGMADFASQYNVSYGPQMAASFISIVPVLVIFAFAQRYFIEGTMSSGIKG